MIHVAAALEPKQFDEKVRMPGLRAIAEMVGEKPKRKAGPRFKKKAARREDLSPSDFPAYWTECLSDLMKGYREVCAYSCFRIHPVTGAHTVDHMAPKSRNWNRVYEWDNYRLACARLNSRKNHFEDVLDPFEVENGWFHLELVGFTVFPNRKLSKALQKEIENTIERLGLNDFRSSREHDAERYWSQDVSLSVLRIESPFVAHELKRQGRLNNKDEDNESV
jgi:hypothetical protein